jgi:hypothetical protein
MDIGCACRWSELGEREGSEAVLARLDSIRDGMSAVWRSSSLAVRRYCIYASRVDGSDSLLRLQEATARFISARVS